MDERIKATVNVQKPVSKNLLLVSAVSLVGAALTLREIYFGLDGGFAAVFAVPFFAVLFLALLSVGLICLFRYFGFQLNWLHKVGGDKIFLLIFGGILLFLYGLSNVLLAENLMPLTILSLGGLSFVFGIVLMVIKIIISILK